jgi:hypothetical protein
MVGETIEETLCALSASLHGDGRSDGHGSNLGPNGHDQAMVVVYCRIVAGDSWWLLGSSDITRSPRDACPGMVVVAYSPVRVRRPFRRNVVDLGFLLCKDGDLPEAGLS